MARDDYMVRPATWIRRKFGEWSADNQEGLKQMLTTMPAAGIKLHPNPDAGTCATTVVINGGAWAEDDAVQLIQKLPENFAGIYPFAQGALRLAEMFYGEKDGYGNECGAFASALPLVKAALGRMIASLDHLFKPQGTESELTLWRGVHKGRYAWVEEAGDDNEEWERRLIQTLQATYFSTSTNKTVSRRTFLSDGGILIKLVGSCRGISSNGALQAPWDCFDSEDEVLVAPHQTFEVVRGKTFVQRMGSKRNFNTITLRVTYTEPEFTSRWVNDPDDPHFELARRS